MKLPAYDILFQDPGLRECGEARFDANTGRLKRAWLSRNSETKKRGPVAWVLMSNAIYWDMTMVHGFKEPLSLVVSEYPQVYDPKFQKGDQADLIELAGVVGAVAGASNVAVTGFLPREWKGQQPKEVTEARLRELPYPAGLLPEEWAAIADCPRHLLHNVIDAVALGVWYLRKIKVRK